MATDYVLGNDQEELNRLNLQHQLWKSELFNLWNKTLIQKATSVLDLGCGPGFTSLDLLDYIQPEMNQISEMTSVDISENFLNYLQAQVEQRFQAHTLNNKKLNVHRSSIEQLQLIKKDFQFAFCRWLLIFVQNPELALKKIHEHLRPGGQFIIQEYVSYDSMDLVPDFKSMKPVVEAIFKSWYDQGGDPNRGKKLPYLLEKTGFKVKWIEPIAKFARPEDPLWQWPETFYLSFLPRLQNSGYLTSSQVQEFFHDWNSAKKVQGAYFIAPTVINIIAEK